MQRNGFILSHTELSDAFVKRLKASGLSLLGIHPGGGERAAELLENYLSEYVDDPKFCGMTEELENAGFEIEHELHALRWLLPKKVFAHHPEWQRMNADGERVSDVNFCVSNPDVLEYVTERSYELARRLHQKSRIYNIWMDDVPDGYCHCEKCRSLSPSDQTLIFGKAVLRGLRAYNPRAKESYLAYQQTMELPKNVRTEEGIFLEYAPMEHWLHGTDEFKYIQPLLNFFGSSDSKVLEYWVDNSLFSSWKLPPVKCPFELEKMKRDVKMYTEYGFETLTSFGLYLGDDYTELYGEFDLARYASGFDADV